jgi:hypothetical protein
MHAHRFCCFLNTPKCLIFATHPTSHCVPPSLPPHPPTPCGSYHRDMVAYLTAPGLDYANKLLTLLSGARARKLLIVDCLSREHAHQLSTTLLCALADRRPLPHNTPAADK